MSQSQRPILSLPFEIRIMIWKLVLTPDNRILTVDIGSTESASGGLTYWARTKASFHGMLACKQMYNEMRRILSVGLILDLTDHTSHPLPLGVVITHQGTLQAIKTAMMDLQGAATAEPWYPTTPSAGRGLCPPNLKAIALPPGHYTGEQYSQDGVVWTRSEIRDDQIRRYDGRRMLKVTRADRQNININMLFLGARADVRLFLDYTASCVTGCGGNCSEWRESARVYETVLGFCAVDYEVGVLCDCKEEQRWCATAVRTPVARTWSFIEREAGDVDALRREVLKWMLEEE